MVNASPSPLRLLLIGPLPPPIGGSTVLFRLLADALAERPDISLDIIDTSPGGGQTGPIHNAWRSVAVLFQALKRIRRADLVSLHANLRGRLFLGPPLYLLTRLLRKPLITRAFAGHFDSQLRSVNPLLRWIVMHTYFKAEACLLETNRLAEHFRERGFSNAHWFPNCTRLLPRPPGQTVAAACRRLVFLSVHMREKGVDLVLDLAERLPAGVGVDMFGPLRNGYTAGELNRRGRGRIVYRGVLQPEEVAARLWDYDALLLPTFCPTEGYPAVILEAYAHGLPVITTTLPSIREIVDDSCGVLVPPGDAVAFGAAVERLCGDDAFYAALAAGAAERSKAFSHVQRADQFLDLCRDLVARRRSGGGRP